MKYSFSCRVPQHRFSSIFRLLSLLLLGGISLYFSAPSLSLAPLFRPFLSQAAYQTYQDRKVQLGLDLSGGMDVIYQVQSLDPKVVQAAASVLRSRLALDGVSGAEVRVQQLDQLRAQVPCQDEQRCQDLWEILETADLLQLYEVLAEAPSPMQLTELAGTKVLALREPPTWFLVRERPGLTGEALQAVHIGFDSLTGSPVIELQFTREGGREFAALSRRTVGKRVAVVLGGEVVTVPVMEQEIATGQAQLRGHFEIQEARRLARLLQAGALPAPLVRLSRSTVGPTLGAEAVVQCARACAGGLGAVGIFMALKYGKAGVLSAVGVGLNLLMQTAALQLTGTALTLPGFAGVALTVGMAVDANVLCFERIREEREAGRSRRVALAVGFRKAWSAIIDSNLTTLLTSLILFLFGSGPVRGFAISLGLGILCSLVTALWAVRCLMEVGEELGLEIV
jgi:protein-export membrane protein SecD